MANYTTTISSTDEICLQTDCEIQSWIDLAVSGKINNTKKRLIRKYVDHCTTNEIQMKVTSDEQVTHARALGLAEFISEIDQSLSK